MADTSALTPESPDPTDPGESPAFVNLEEAAMPRSIYVDRLEYLQEGCPSVEPMDLIAREEPAQPSTFVELKEVAEDMEHTPMMPGRTHSAQAEWEAVGKQRQLAVRGSAFALAVD